MITSNPENFFKSAFGAAAKETVSRLYSQILANIEGTREGSDIEALHDMRVASRRLRAALKVFAECFPRKYRVPVENDIKDITRALGQVRDQDVFVDFLRQNSFGLSKASLRWLVDRECRIRDGARITMLASLDNFERSDINYRLEDLLQHTRKTQADSKKLKLSQFGRHAHTLVTPRLYDVCAFDDIITDPSDIAGLHAMRIAAKKFRYTLETFVPCFGEIIQNDILQLKTLQDFLGKIHDYDIWTEKLLAYSNDPGLTTKQHEAIEKVISYISEDRLDTYNQLLEFWQNLRASGYAENLEISLKKIPA